MNIYSMYEISAIEFLMAIVQKLCFIKEVELEGLLDVGMLLEKQGTHAELRRTPQNNSQWPSDSVENLSWVGHGDGG